MENNPNRPEDGTREVTFSRNLWIEADDFLAQPIPKYKRLYPDGPECRLKGAYLIKCTGCVTDENGNVVEVLATYDPDAAGKDYLSCLNPQSLEVLTGCKVEASLADAKAPMSFQFMRLGYFCPDSKDSIPGHLVFNRSVSLKDSFKPGK